MGASHGLRPMVGKKQPGVLGHGDGRYLCASAYADLTYCMRGKVRCMSKVLEWNQSFLEYLRDDSDKTSDP